MIKTNKAKIAVFVSGGGTNLQALIDAQQKGLINCGEISLVVSNKPNAYALCRAQQNGIPTFCYSGKADFERAVLEQLSLYNIDMIVLAGFLKILSANFVNRYSKRIINIHPSLLPDFAGLYGINVHQQVLASKRTVTGATVHYVSEVTDGGEIILQKKVEILPIDTPESLQLRVMEQAEWVILPQATQLVAEAILKNKNS